MNLLVVPFIETTIPNNLEENEWGVAHHVLMAKGFHKSQNTRWSIEIMSVNGIWYGASDAQTSISGYGGPCTRHWTTPFTNAEDCIDYYYAQICSFFRQNNKKVPPRPSFELFVESYPYDNET